MHCQSSNLNKSRFESLRAKVQQRYPNTSVKDLPSITASFLILHEFTAILPLVFAFLVLKSTDLGDQIVEWVELHSKSERSDKEQMSGLDYLRSSMRTGLQEGNQKINKIAHKYGWESSEHENLAIIKKTSNGSLIVNGLAAYLIVKALLPFRIAISLYFAPSMAKLLSNRFLALRTRISSKSQ
ncbi:hypothetical protein CROQUDRAFT_48862 [Cronartium quercuum f. sp. fusiforme G11]|uniref:Uncharacterized protein n=1 Tax=Cronartium quercuum f. sp. fusiforme G11 TaxID=708437 RepID=A0A9P6NGY3_9BASI|nr:hypothetical protein CROQUDRAFT_48862 [Cronartium quercuum f. sp. fusiforme G11]